MTRSEFNSLKPGDLISHRADTGHEDIYVILYKYIPSRFSFDSVGFKVVCIYSESHEALLKTVAHVPSNWNIYL